MSGFSHARRAVVLGLFSAVVACGMRSGSASARAEETACAPDITGCWDCGSWNSCCTGHHGKLRATICRCDACHYTCTFSGTFFKVIPFRYKATLTVTKVENGVVYFRSSRNLPMFGGSFCMTGHASACSFHANYTSPKDRGTFQMSR